MRVCGRRTGGSAGLGLAYVSPLLGKRSSSHCRHPGAHITSKLPCATTHYHPHLLPPAAALGGEVGKNPSRRFVLKVERLRLTPGLQRDPAYLQALADVAAGREAKPPAGERPAGAQWASAGVGGDADRAGTADVPEGGAAASGATVPTSSGSAGLIRLIQSHGDQVWAPPWCLH